MKTGLLNIAMIVSLFFAATITRAQAYKISGEIKDLDVDYGYIAIEDPKAERGFRIDSIKMENGKFVYSGEVDAPEVLRMSFRSDRLLKWVGRGYIPTKSALLHFVAYPDADIKVEGAVTDFCNAYPYGDPENEILTGLHAKIYPLMNDNVNIYLKTLVDSTLSEEQKKNMELESEELGTKINQMRLDFLDKSASSIAGLWLMEDMIIRSQIEIEKVAELMERIDEKYSDLGYYQNLTRRVEGYKTTGVGMVAPSIRGENIMDGTDFQLKSLRGKYVIIDFWGTWCGPCITGMPEMKAFRDKHKEKLQIVGLAKDRSLEAVRKCMKENDMDWPNIMIGSGEQDYVAHYNVQGYPTKILLDRNGKILLRSVGETGDFYYEVEELISK